MEKTINYRTVILLEEHGFFYSYMSSYKKTIFANGEFVGICCCVDSNELELKNGSVVSAIYISNNISIFSNSYSFFSRVLKRIEDLAKNRQEIINYFNDGQVANLIIITIGDVLILRTRTKYLYVYDGNLYGNLSELALVNSSFV